MSHEKKKIEPCINGAREWNEVFGSYVKQAYVWRLFAFMSIIIAAISVGGVVYIGSQSKIVPYIVEVDKHGSDVIGGYATKISPIDPKIIKYGLSEFVINFKTVYPDHEIQKDYVFKSYRYLVSNFPAYMAVSKYYQDNSPFERSQKERVTITIMSVLQMSKDTWQIDWSEKITNDQGITRAVDGYRGLATIDIIPPKTESEVLKNPVGLYIKEFTWSKLINTQDETKELNK
ncbi:MAG: hypothetical protein JXQ76_06005 [Campylobacterales bacterium]|nr:hypothetical protein [Campylobacterales bacterium]